MSIPDSVEVLNEREQEIIECLVDGLSNREIADKLFLAPSTVKWYIRQLNQKLDTANRREIVEQVQELGLIEAEVPQESYFRPRENLPRQTTPFVGRDSELDELHAIIEKEDIRLLTILAPGGMGKTRIALEATEQQINRFPDGVYFVPLQALSEPEQIIPQIASSTFFSFQNDNRSQKQQVLDFLSNKTMLLCIDNWEHLLDGALLVNEILAVAPQVKIIATSREKLNLLAETVYVLQGMEFPEWETPDDALRYDAVQLLLQSAQRVKLDWTITEENLDYVARVCRLTQGMPLGILLASSWLDVYSLERICEEIQKSTDILETDMRDIPERQRSIRAVFDYSWERLKLNEQDVLMKMSIFRGGCSPEAAEAITGANGRILQSLVNKALLLKNREGRYDIHELLRQYAEERLQQSDIFEATQQAHTQYYAEAIHQCEAQLIDHRQQDAVASIEIDFENVRMAWLSSLRVADYEIIDQMLGALHLFLELDSRTEEGKELFTLAISKLDLLNKDNQSLLSTKLITRLADFANKSDNFEHAETLLQKSLDPLREQSNISELAFSLRVLSYAQGGQYKIEEAIQSSQESLSLYTKLNDIFGMARAHFATSGHYFNLNEREKGLKHTEKAYELYREIGNKFGMSGSLNRLAEHHLNEGQQAISDDYAEKALKLAHEMGFPLSITNHLLSHAQMQLARGNIKKAKELVRESQMFARESGKPEMIMFATWMMSCVVEAEGKFEEAQQLALEGFHYAEKNALFEASPISIIQLLSERRLGITHIWLGNFNKALDRLRIPFQKIVELGHFITIYNTIAFMIPIVAQGGQAEYAVELLGLYSAANLENNWIEIHRGFMELRANLRESLGDEAYNEAFERGKSLDLMTVAQQLIDELWDNES